MSKHRGAEGAFLDETAPLRHSLSYLVRQSDAHVRLRVDILLEEFFYNLLGPYSLPVVLYRHGLIGARNRRYIGNSVAFKMQLFCVSMFTAANLLYFVFRGQPGFNFTAFELVFINVLACLRAIACGVKYSTYTLAEWRELDKTQLSDAELASKLMLNGWSNTPDHLMFAEMERAIVRSCPHMSRHRIVFPNRDTRKAVLFQMLASVPSFVRFELCQECTLDTVKPHDAAKCATCKPFAVADPTNVFLAHFGSLQSQSQLNFLSTGRPQAHSDDDSTETDTVTSQSLHDSSLVSPNPQQGAMEQYDPAGVPDSIQGRLKPHLPLPTLPTLPAKLFLWHILRTAAAQARSLNPRYGKLAALLAVMLAILPISVRGAMGGLSDLSGAGIASTVIFFVMTFIYLANILSFIFVGVYDHSRRLYAAKSLQQLLDANALLALRMHDDADGSEEPNVKVPLASEHPASRASSPDVTDIRNSVHSDSAPSVVVVGNSGAANAGALLRKRSTYKQEFAHMELFPERDDKVFAQLLKPQRIPLAHFVPSGFDSMQEQPQFNNSVTHVVPASSLKALPGGAAAGVATRHVAGGGNASVVSDDPEDEVFAPVVVARRIQENMLSKHQCLTSSELRDEVLGESMLHVSLPLLYPQNVIAWSHMRSTAMDMGRSYYYRIMIFTTLFASVVGASVVFLFFMLAHSFQMNADTVIVLSLTCLGQLSLALAVIAQVVQASRVNRSAAEHQLRLNRIESIAYEYLATARIALPAAVRDRLLQAKKVAAAVIEGIMVEDKLQPARVMGVPANLGLLGTFASVTLSGVLATYQSLSSAK